MSGGRFIEEQSKIINRVNILGEGVVRMLFRWWMVVFSRRRVGSLSGLVLAVALHIARIWE